MTLFLGMVLQPIPGEAGGQAGRGSAAMGFRGVTYAGKYRGGLNRHAGFEFTRAFRRGNNPAHCRRNHYPYTRH